MSEIEIVKSDKVAILFGATGLIGAFLLDYLLNNDNYSKVIVFTRHSTNIKHPKLEEKVINFMKLPHYEDEIKGDDLFMCLGTTLAKAGSKKTFYQIDYNLNFTIAKMAEKNKVNQILLVSSVGASQDSRFFYSRVKGKLEDDLKLLNFWSIRIFQPSILLGERNENRLGEDLAQIIGRGLNFISGGLLKKYKPVEAEVVAKAMVEVAQHLEKGVHVYPSHWLQDLSEKQDALRPYK